MMVPRNPTSTYTHPATCVRSSPAGNNHLIKPELFVRFQVLFSLHTHESLAKCVCVRETEIPLTSPKCGGARQLDRGQSY